MICFFNTRLGCNLCNKIKSIQCQFIGSLTCKSYAKGVIVIKWLNYDNCNIFYLIKFCCDLNYKITKTKTINEMLINVWPFLSFSVSYIWSCQTLYCGHAECTRLVIVLIQGISGKEFKKFNRITYKYTFFGLLVNFLEI